MEYGKNNKDSSVNKQSLFSRLTSALGGDSPDHLLRNVFEPIAGEHPQLTRDLVNFCRDGEPAAVLGRAQPIIVPQPQGVFGPFFTTRWYWSYKKNTSSKARVALYRKLSEGKVEPTVLIRMAKAFAELLDNVIEKHTRDDFPDWLHLIITDWLYNLEENPRNATAKGSFDAPPLTVEALKMLCLEGGLHEAAWLPYYFDRNNVSSYWGFEQSLEVFRKLEGVDRFLMDNAAYFTDELYPGFTALGKSHCLIELGTLSLADKLTDFVARQAVSSSKMVRAEAARLLATLPEEKFRPQLEDFLVNGKAAERKSAAEFIGRTMGAHGRSLLEAALEAETSKSVASTIEVALGGTVVKEESEAETPLQVPAYEKPNLNAVVSDEVVELIDAHICKLKEKYRDFSPEHAWQKKEKKYFMSLSRANAADVVRAMNKGGKPKFNWQAVARFMQDAGLFEHPSIDLINVIRLYGLPRRSENAYRRHFDYGPLTLWLRKHRSRFTDLRELADVLKAVGWPDDTIEHEILYRHWDTSPLFSELPAEGIWPYFAQRNESLVTALSGPVANRNYIEDASMDRLLEVLGCFPSLPGALRAPLLQIALGEGKTYRERAQTLLGSVPGIEQKVLASLKSTAQESRINAARWLGRLGKTEAVGALSEALNKESREAARATMLSALETLGEDISELLSPERLLKEAQKGLKKKMPKGLEWFPFDALPPLQWQDGSAVEAELPKWWVVLACKLKDPGGNELLLKYLQRLAEPSRHTFGLSVLRAFIAQDTRTPTLDEAEEKARQGAPALLKQWQHWAGYEWGKDYKNRTLEDAHASIRQEVMGTYLGSAIKEKGILALCAYTPGAEAVALLRAYMKDHYTRRAQIESMLKALAPGNDSHVIQLMLSVARRYRTRSVQETARGLVEAVAERNGWSQDELADRTLPTAGFDEQGAQQLDYGSRTFTVSLDDSLKPVLKNEEGKTIKSLPAPRQADDGELVKEAKARFSACKKELKQVVQLTSGRFYEAMCAQREWPVADWRKYLFEHPVANRLIQRLVWMVEDDGDPIVFRPTEDGAFIDVEDEEVTLPESGRIRLVHRSVLPESAAEAWTGHLKDYGVKPLFEQISRPVLSEEADLKQTALDTYEGYLSDSFTLRGVLTKLGYQRGEAEDAGFFYYYHKEFASLGLRAVIQFSGNCLPEENIPAALQTLGFIRMENRGWFSESNLLRLKEVPPILLSEVMADYKAVADKTGGYDKDWQKKIPW
jgi:hypothetical protein